MAYPVDMTRKRLLAGGALVLTMTTQALADNGAGAGAAIDLPASLETSLDDDPEIGTAPRYITREEAREAGQAHQLTDWLSLTTLVEIEVNHNRGVDGEAADYIDNQGSLTFQLGMTFDISDNSSIRFVTEYDSDEHGFLTEEALLVFEYDPWEMAVGRQYTPFGSYYSRFVTGPMVEFGETLTDKSAALTYAPGDELDLTLMLYQGRAVEEQSSSEEWDWSLGLEVWLNNMLAVGLGYQSDIADSDEELLNETANRYQSRVAGGTAYLLMTGTEYEFSLEYLTALSSFKELPPNRDKPSAWNGEISRHFVSWAMELALRLEASHELADMPTQRYGISMTKHLTPSTYFTLEYLRERFGRQAVFQEEDDTLEHNNLFAAKLTIEF